MELGGSFPRNCSRWRRNISGEGLRRGESSENAPTDKRKKTTASIPLTPALSRGERGKPRGLKGSSLGDEGPRSGAGREHSGGGPHDCGDAIAVRLEQTPHGRTRGRLLEDVGVGLVRLGEEDRPGRL